VTAPEITIKVNGITTACPQGSSIDALLRQLQLPVDRVAVERNRRIVRRDEREGVTIEEGDVVEVVTFVGGG
jgi:thiamine biosynthesis protein ThiS